ncbi:MAG TPA: hypothetical protein VFA46_06370 [Actinomycetes bacterium]|jgi:hypothetical protein|nr:hypothetical protein [Actinomycetes bacterium]
MTATTAGSPLTVRAVLGGGGDLDKEIERALQVTGATQRLGGGVASLSRSARRQVSRDLAAAVVGVSDLDIGDILVAGWRKHRTLLGAAQRTLEVPGSRETVKLASHRISHSAEPYVDILLGDVRLTRVTITVRIVIDITGVEASVRDGRLMALHCGDATAMVSLAIKHVPVAARSIHLDLPVDVPVGDGLPLCEEARVQRPRHETLVGSAPTRASSGTVQPSAASRSALPFARDRAEFCAYNLP